MSDYSKGDLVKVNHQKYPGVWRVVSVGPTNTLLERVEGVGRLRVPHSLLMSPDNEDTAAEIPTFFNVGALVRIPSGRFAGLYVVIKDSGADKVNVAKLGGDGGHYVRALRGSLVPVDPSEVLA